MPVSGRTGRRYATGSEMSKQGYTDVKVCASCGRRLLLRESAQYETVGGEAQGWHVECGRPMASGGTFEAADRGSM